jgi:hypothetical protein
MIEDKDNEISRLLDENKNLRQSLQSRPPVCFSFHLFSQYHENQGIRHILNISMVLHFYPIGAAMLSNDIRPVKMIITTQVLIQL